MRLVSSTSLPKIVSTQIKDGSYLVGDDFNDEQLRRWFTEEQEAFYEMDKGNSEEDPWYSYMRYVNDMLGFSMLKKHVGVFNNVLVLGPGAGKEIERFSKENSGCQMHFLEASENFQKILQERFSGARIIAPQYTGNITLEDSSQDVVCAFSVLHHIPNVSKVLAEIGRVTRQGGMLMVREPCSSMGDWRGERSATPNERGISRSLMIKFAEQAGFSLTGQPTAIIFEPFNKLLKRTIGFNWIPFRILYIIDFITSLMLSLNDHYWRDTFIKKLGPSSYFYLFIKQ